MKKEQIIKLIKQKPELSTFEIAEIIGCTERYVRMILKRLDKNKKVKQNLKSIEVDKKIRQLEIDKNYYKKKFEQTLNDLTRLENFVNLLGLRIEAFQPVKYPENLNDCQNNKQKSLEAVLLLSDLHIGEVVNLSINKFNILVATRRIEILAEKIIEKIKQLRINRLWIFALGDIVTGGIHEELAKTNEYTEIDQTIIASQLISFLIRDIAQYVPEIKFIGVVGNHGRLTKKYEFKNIHNSFDYLTYKLVETYLSNQKNVEFAIPKEKNAIVEIKGYNFLLSHGDNIRSWSGIPFYGIERYSSNIRRVYSNMDTFIHCIVHGHFHVPFFQINSGKDCKIVNGSLKGVDEFSLANQMYSEACQVMFTVSDENIIEDTFILWTKEQTDKPERYIIQFSNME